MLDNYDAILEPGTSKKRDMHIAKLMNHLAEGTVEKELIIKNRTNRSGGGQWGSNDK
jgi:hypothetical protein